tara:strand:- start:617 stop:1099 length:483 start_codon:yes stop_codon:yes gene_type:complete
MKEQNDQNIVNVSDKQWGIINDSVMGGISMGSFKIEKDRVIFYGKLSSQFNGGFASIRNRERIHLDNNEKITLKVIGDGNTYQVRIKDSYHNFHSYYHEFSTIGKEEEITLSLADFKPVYRGTNLFIENFDKKTIDELSFMIVSVSEPNFKLEIIEVSIN